MMSSSWSARQEHLGDLRTRSTKELQELLILPEKFLENRRFVQSLPDKGKKIQEFVEKLRLALEQRDEEERRLSLVSDASTELQSKYQQAFTAQQHPAPAASQPSSHPSTHCLPPIRGSQPIQQKEAPAGDTLQENEASPGSARMQEAVNEKGDTSSSTAAAFETMETTVAGASVNPDGTKEEDLAEALERVTLSGTRTGLGSMSKEPLNCKTEDNYFLSGQTTKTSRFVEVLVKTQKYSAPRKQKFKSNQLPQKGDISQSGSSPPSQSSEGSSQLSAQERRQRDRKHLDDVTAATLPPLHHSPIQILSLEESAHLLMEQTKKQQELEAKLAAQKLSQELKISMGSYTPDGGSMAAYREVHDEGTQLSSDED